jgi:hypothetical protein
VTKKYELSRRNAAFNVMMICGAGRSAVKNILHSTVQSQYYGFHPGLHRIYNR